MAIFNRCECSAFNSQRSKVCKRCGRKLGKDFYIQYSIDGRRKTEKIGDSLGFAKEVLAKRQTDVREGKFFGDSKSIHWLEFFDNQYLNYCLNNLSGFTRSRFDSARNFKTFHKSMNKITRSDIEAYRDSLNNGKRNKATINRYIQVVKFAFNYAESLELIDRNPARRLKMFKEEHAERKVISLEDEDKLLQTSLTSKSPLLYYFIIIGLYTGMRYSEIMDVKWSNVSFKMKSIKLYKTKSNEIREIPMMEKLYQAMKELRDITGDFEYVLTNPDTGKKIDYIKRAFRTAVKSTDMPYICIHEMRHTMITRLAASGASVPEIQQISGHKTAKMVQRYTHVGLKEAHRTIDRLSAYLDESKNIDNRSL